MTQGSPLKVDGSPHPKACTVPGGAIERGEKRKPTQYREAWQARGRVRLLTLACETGGRWSDQCVDFVRMLAAHKAKEAPPILQRSAEYGWQSRWWTLLSCSAHRTFAASICVNHRARHEASKSSCSRQRAPGLRWPMVANFGGWKPRVRNFRVCPCAHEVRARVFLANPFSRGQSVGYGWMKDKSRNNRKKNTFR